MPEINGERVLADLRALKALAPYKTGVHRPTLSPEHVASLKWLVGELGTIGHEAKLDGIANVFGISKETGPKLLGGSHLESQNHAGWLDGPLGVVYALEAARAIAADPAYAGCGVDVIACCDEPPSCGCDAMVTPPSVTARSAAADATFATTRVGKPRCGTVIVTGRGTGASGAARSSSAIHRLLRSNARHPAQRAVWSDTDRRSSSDRGASSCREISARVRSHDGP